MDRQEKFYQHFKDQMSSVRQQISRIGDEPASGRQQAHDRILAAVSALSTEVSDAAEYVSSYDRRNYAQTIKTVQDDLKNTMAKVAPRSRFQFKSRGTATASAAMTGPARSAVPGCSTSPAPVEPPPSSTVQRETEPQAPSRDYNAVVSSSTMLVRRPSFSSAASVALTSHAGLHIALPATAATATSSAGSLTNLRSCVVDMSTATFPTLTLRDISDCVVVAGRINGPVHATNLVRSKLAIAARQVRMHDCKDVDVYLSCGSRPIIEDCAGMRFAPLPGCLQGDDYDADANQWDQVDDFKWLKAEDSPNWGILPEGERLGDGVWRKALVGERPAVETMKMLFG